jgi:cytochrome P450
LHEFAWLDSENLSFGTDLGVDPTSPVRPFAQSGVQGWYVTGHRETRALLTDPRLTTSRSAAAPAVRSRCPEMFAGGRLDLAESIAGCDGPAHSRLRRLVGRAFTPSVLHRLRPLCRQAGDELVAGFAQRGEAELVGEYARPLAVATTMELLGVPRRERGDLAAVGEIDSSSFQAVQARFAQLRSHIADLVARKREEAAESPGTPCDLLRQLAAVRDGEDRLTDEEISTTALLFLVAGCRTTPAMVAGSLWRLLGDKELRGRARKWTDGGEAPDPAVIDEVLRHAPTGEDKVVRFATQEVVVAGQAISVGDLVLLDLARAARDPAVFDEPDVLRLDRAPNPHLVFGQGLHNCLGGSLVRMQTAVALSALVGRYDGLRVADGNDAVVWRGRGSSAWPTRLAVVLSERR